MSELPWMHTFSRENNTHGSRFHDRDPQFASRILGAMTQSCYIGTLNVVVLSEVFTAEKIPGGPPSQLLQQPLTLFKVLFIWWRCCMLLFLLWIRACCWAWILWTAWRTFHASWRAGEATGRAAGPAAQVHAIGGGWASAVPGRQGGTGGGTAAVITGELKTVGTSVTPKTYPN